MRSLWQLAGLALALTTLAAGPSRAEDQAPLNPPGECTLSTRSTTEIDVALSRHGVSMVDFLTFCDGLVRYRVGIDAAGHAASLGDHSTALVVLHLYDLEGGTAGPESSFGFVEEPGNDEAARMTAYSRAYNLALGEVERDLTTFVASVAQEMGRLDGLYRAGVTPAVAPAQQPCTMTYRATDAVEQVIAARHALPDFADYTPFCEALRARGAGLELVGAQLQVEDRLHTVLGVFPYDLATGVQGNFHGYATSAAREATEEDRQVDMWDALQAAMEGMASNSDQALGQLDDVLARDRAFYPVGE
jgi:hypothetical protein